MIIVLLVLGGLLTGCGKHYWQGQGHVVFMIDSPECIQEATIKYDIASEQIYRACMRARGWKRVRTQYPTNDQFRGPESQEEFANPPSPWSKRGPEPRRITDPTCDGPTASRPAHCPR
jgi:hypothetical protein